MVNDTLSWDAHIDQLLPRMNTSCYALRTIKALVSREALRMLYFAYVHPILTYGIIFWGNTPNSTKVFRMQKKILRIMTNLKRTDSCREVFRTMDILPFYSQYIFSLLLYVVNNKNQFVKNFDIHKFGTRTADNFHFPTTYLSKYQKGVQFTAIKIFSHLPSHIKCVANETKIFKTSLKKFLRANSFYSIEEYFNHNE
jgi:hypothetical protein